MRIVNSYIATQYHSKVHTCLEFSYYDEANETTTRFITLSIFSDVNRTMRLIPTNSNICFLHQSIPIHIVKIIKQLVNILNINKLWRFQHANALTIAKLKNIFIKAFKWTTKIQFFSRTTIYFVCDLSYILMTYIIKRR